MRWKSAIIAIMVMVCSSVGARAQVQYYGWQTLQSTVSTGNGSELDINGFESVAITVEMTSTGTVNLKIKGDGSYRDLSCVDLSTRSLVTSVTASANLQCPSGGMASVQTPIAANGGTIVVKARAANAEAGAAGSGGGGGGTQYAEDSVHVSGDTLTMAGVVRHDATAALAADGDRTVLQVDGDGNLKVVNSNPNLAADNSTNSTSKVPTLSGTASASNPSWTEGRQVPGSVDLNGYLRTRTIDPCSYIAKTHIPINISTATTTELTVSLAGASTNYYVCAIDLVTAGANNVALVDDDTDNCASVTSGLAGGTTAASGWNLAANGGLVKGNGAATVFKTGGVNRVLCLVTSVATQLSGSIQVVAAP